MDQITLSLVSRLTCYPPIHGPERMARGEPLSNEMRERLLLPDRE